MTASAELLPCPFCGGKANVTVEASGRFHLVECSACPVDMAGTDESEAIAVWNRRSTPTGEAGMVLVPREPTLAMSMAGEAEYIRKGLGVWSDFHAIYLAMIDAALKAQP